MLLTKTGKPIAERYTFVADDAPVPGEGAVLLNGERYLAEAHALTARAAPVGVRWPNHRDVSLLAPHVGKLAMIALEFPSFRDGRAYSQARRLRENFGYRGELRATGNVLRDQFLFMLRSGFDTLDVQKEHDAAHFAEAVARYSVHYQAASDGHTAVAGFLRRRGPEHIRIANKEVDADMLDRQLEGADPAGIVAEALRVVPAGRLALVSSFGIESAALLKIVADIRPSLPVIFLDTEWLFGETLAYRDALIAHFGLTDVRTVKPHAAAIAHADPDYDLWARDQEACCHLRKVAPLAEALRPFDAWISGRKRYQGARRSLLPVVERDGQRLKINPLARVSPRTIAALFRAANLPRHPLAAKGYPSVGCIPCTTMASSREGVRAGRWRGSARTECGIHT